jgi:hypothetical protein
LEVGGNHIPRLDPVFDHLEVTHVWRKQRLHPAAINAVSYDNFVGSLPQGVKERRLKHVAIARQQCDQQPVGAAKLSDVCAEIRTHVLVPHRQLLGERSIDSQSPRRHEQQDDRN